MGQQCAWCGRYFEGLGYEWGTFCSARCMYEGQTAAQARAAQEEAAGQERAAQQEAARQEQAAEEARRWAALPEDEKIRIKIRELENAAAEPTFHAWLKRKFPPFALLPDTSSSRGTWNSAGARATWMVATLLMLIAGCLGVGAIIAGPQASHKLFGVVCLLPSLLYFALLVFLGPCYLAYLYAKEGMKKELNRDIYDEIDHLRAKLARLRKAR